MAEVFISYSQKDRELVAPVAARLAELGVDVWFDGEISAGERFGAVIRQKLKEVKAALVCWSPEAVASEWVDSEADFARELGNYVPIKISPCALEPPFNRIHTEDLSNWSHSANDPAWLKIVDRISKLIGRDGVAAGAHAFASADEKALYDFARRYPDEPAARKIWSDAEARHRVEFESRLAQAHEAAAARAARITAEAADLDGKIAASVSAFEAWLAEERHGTAKGEKPDPLLVAKRYVPNEEKKLREEVSALTTALAQAKAGEEEFEAAKAEATRLSEQLQASSDEAQRLRRDVADLSDASNQAKARAEEIGTAKAEIAKLSKELTSARANVRPLYTAGWSSPRAWPLAALAIVAAAGAGALAERSVLLPTRDAAGALNAQVESLTNDLVAARERTVKLQGELDASRLESQAAAKQWEDLKSQVAAVPSESPPSTPQPPENQGSCETQLDRMKKSGDLGPNPDERGFLAWCSGNAPTYLPAAPGIASANPGSCEAQFDRMKKSGDLGPNPSVRGFLAWCRKQVGAKQ